MINNVVSEEKNNVYMLKLEDIAFWVLRKQMHKQPDIIADLPSLQRGFVWKAEQIETLWDSIARGFPIGSLLLSDIREGEDQATGHFKGGEESDTKGTHYLLDGQQRATSIALAFNDVWTKSNEDATSALWVDLKSIENSDRHFSFRLVTKSHPWGYSQEDPSKRLKDWQAREALESFRKVKKEGDLTRPHEFKIFEVFPWNAEAPVPVALLLSSILESKSDNDQLIKCLLKNLEKTHLSDDRLENIKGILFGNNGRPGFMRLIEGLRKALNTFEVPAPVLNVSGYQEYGDDEKDSTFNLFKRVNSGGTVLSAEEIKYSLLKTVWIEAPDVIEKELLSKRKIAQPARMVSLMSRLFLMIKSKNENKSGQGLQAELKIGQFRKMIADDKEGFKSFCTGDGKNIVDYTWILLTQEDEGLPKVLAVQMSQGSGDVLLLLMYWVSKVLEAKVSIEGLQNNRKEILGFITSLAWFAIDQKSCIKKLAKQLVDFDQKNIILFFNHERFCALVSNKDKNIMPPLPTPEMLEKTLLYQELNTELTKNTDFNDDLWKVRSLEDLYRQNHDAILPKDWFSDATETRKYTALFLVSHLCKDNKRWLLTYAQRKIMKDEEWFAWFDPTQPDQIRDRNRPWDYDHILPKSWAFHPKSSNIFSEFPYFVRIWIRAIGNFRIWPLECNRSKGAVEMIEPSLKEYGLADKDAVLMQSFIRDCNMKLWKELEKELPKKGEGVEFWRGCSDGERRTHWQLFVKASIARTVDIYREWYDQLHISSLMK